MPRHVGQRINLCTACRHEERGRIDFLIASGGSPKTLAPRFGLKPTALYNHSKRHISDDYRRAVKIGPFSSEEQLRKLCADNGAGVLDSLKGIYGGLAGRWLIAFESGSDAVLCMLTTKMLSSLELQAKLTKELLPPGPTTSVTNNVLINDPSYVQAIGRIAVALSSYPEARTAVAAALRDIGHNAPLMIEARDASAGD